MGDIEFRLDSDTMRPDAEVTGSVEVSYPGGYDGVVINAQILDSNEHVTYVSCNGKRTSNKVARLFIGRDSMPDGRAEFAAVIGFEPDKEYEVKFRASIIEQHKEVESKIVFVRYSA